MLSLSPNSRGAFLSCYAFLVIRRASARAVLLLVFALSPGCRAYDARYWSFPLNSMQMVDDATVHERTFGDALEVELLLQLFPWSWIVSAADIGMLPITLVYDFVELAVWREPPYPFDEQVRGRRHQGVAKPTVPAGPTTRGSGAEHLEPAEH